MKTMSLLWPWLGLGAVVIIDRVVSDIVLATEAAPRALAGDPRGALLVLAALLARLAALGIGTGLAAVGLVKLVWRHPAGGE